MFRFVDDQERRARLGHRHQLAPGSAGVTPGDIAHAMTAIHGTDPGSTILGILARGPTISIADIERALYDDRTLIRLLGMRRTLFAVDWELAPAVWASSQPTVVREQRRLLHRVLGASGISNTEHWVQEAERRLLAFLIDHPGSTSTEIASDDPYLGFRVPIPGPGGTQSVTSRLLTCMSADGRVIRARPRGGWTSTQFTWVATDTWRSDWPSQPSTDDADTLIAKSWLRGHGPATLVDFAWWAGWPKGRAGKALDRAGAIEVQTSAGPAFLLETDMVPVASPDPWIALLPGLDSSTMGWKQRDFYLGEHSERVFDNVGNGGPTVWVDGRIVGGWVQLDSGEIAFELFEDIGREASMGIEARAAALQSMLGVVRLKPRARRWTASELALKEKVS